jgi:hypothetical protein
MAREVTDPDILRQLEGGPREVTDPAILRQLEGDKPSTAEDVARSAGGGLVIAGASIPGMVGDIPRVAEAVADQVASVPGRLYNYFAGTGKYEDTESMRRGRAMEKDAIVSIPKATDVLPGGADIARAAAPYTSQVGMDPNYEPKTALGTGTKAVASNAAAALIPGSVAQRVGQVVVPPLVGEAAGQATKGTPLETPARVGAQIATSLGVSQFGRAPYHERLAGRAAQGLDDATAQRAQAIKDNNARHGVPATNAEAIQAATNGGTDLGNLQRVVENTGGGRTLRPFMAQRPGQVDQAGRAILDDVTTYTSAHPSYQGQLLQEAAQAALERTRTQINHLAQPYYRAAENVPIPRQDWATIQNLPGWREALNEVRSNPQLNRYVAHLPDDSVGVLNEVKKQLDTASRNASSQFNVNQNAQVGAGYGRDAGAARQMGQDLSPDYRRALQIEADGRQQVLGPQSAGPVGKIAQTSDPSAQAGAILRNNAPGAQVEATQAGQMLARQNPDALRSVLRQDMEGRFNVATRDNIPGGNEWGGAKYAADLYGNQQQRHNLQAVLDQATGRPIRDDIDSLIEALRTTGQRHRPGSQTSFNDEWKRAMEQGNPILEASKPGTAIRDRVQRYRLQRGSEQLAELLLAPDGIQRLRDLAARGNDQARLLARALLSGEAAASAP